MTTLNAARVELRTALEADGIVCTYAPGGIDPPYVVIVGDGIDLSQRVRGKATFRCVAVGGAADADASALEVDTLKAGILATINALKGWQMGEVRADGIRRLGDSDMLTADVTTTRMIDL